MNYYNEIDKYCAQWLRNLMAECLIPKGEVDERSIVDVQPNDLKGFTQCHFFAGLGGWSRALELAAWPSSRPVWSGSCPCQSFSVASVHNGGAQGQGDERHLWPHFFRLIRKRAPPTIFGEQVASAIGWGWWDIAAMDLEKQNYACAAQVLRADALGASHQRKRLYWVAHAQREGWQGHQPLECIPVPEEAPFTVNGDPLARAGKVLDGDNLDLLPDDGLSVAMERCATKAYGNAIVPQVAAEFISAFTSIEEAA